MNLSIRQDMNKYYRGYSYGSNAATRSAYRARELNEADVKALRASLKDLDAYNYDEGDGKTLIKKVKAFVETYNNLLDSSDKLDSDQVDRYTSKMKKLTKEQRSQLAAIGVNIKSSGKLSIDQDTLEKTSRYKVSKVFGDMNEYNTKLSRYAKQLDRTVRQYNIGFIKNEEKKPGEEKTLTELGSQAAQQQSAEEFYQQLNNSIYNNSHVNYSV